MTLTHTMGEKARKIGARVARAERRLAESAPATYAREHLGPLALIGAGLVWLMRPGSPKDRTDAGRPVFGVDLAQDLDEPRTHPMRSWVQEHPLAALGAAAGAGLLVGLAAPISRRERRLLRPVRSQVVASVTGAVAEARARARETAHRAWDTVQEEPLTDLLGI